MATPTETPQSDSNPNNYEAEESDLEPIEYHDYGNKPLFLCYFFEDLW